MAYGYAVYFSERARNRVIRWDPDSGDAEVVAGGAEDSIDPDSLKIPSAGAEEQRLKDPYGLAIDEKGALLIADKLNHRICRLVKGKLKPLPIKDVNGHRKKLPTSRRGYQPHPSCPSGLFSEGKGSLLCSFAHDNTIYRIKKSGEMEHLLGIVPNRPYLFGGCGRQFRPSSDSA